MPRPAPVPAGAALAVLLAVQVALAADVRSVTDSAGRRVEVPARIERALLPARYAELPTLGRLMGRGNTANVELVLGARPDFIFDYGSLPPTHASLAARVQQQTGIPYVLLARNFYALFYHRAPTDQQLDELTGGLDRARR